MTAVLQDSRNAARDAVSRIMANPDVQNLGFWGTASNWGLKVCHRFYVARESPNDPTASGSYSIHLAKLAPVHRCQSADQDEERWDLFMLTE